MDLNQRKTRTNNLWQEKVNSWNKSGLSQSEYCRRNKINEQQFSKWKTKLSKKHESNFVQVPIRMKKEYSDIPKIELLIKDKYSIKVHSNFNPETLKKIIKTLED